MTHAQFLINPNDLQRCGWQDTPPPPALADGQACIALNHFALTANNITYAKLAGPFSFWRTFPAAPGWGQLPVWGVGTVRASRAPGLVPGQRLYGLYPMAREMVLQPQPAGRTRLIDTHPARRSPARTYDEYTPVTADPLYDPAFEAEHLVFRPLFITSFLLDDLLREQGQFGADEVWLLSASSKTALGLAWLQTTTARTGRARLVGVTSRRNLAFLRGTGYFDEVRCHEDIAEASAHGPWVALMDFSGDAAQLRRLHAGLGPRLVHSLRIGFTAAPAGTMGGAMPADTPLPGTPAMFFFAPQRIMQRRKDWGAAGLQARYLQAWRPFAADTRRWLAVRTLGTRSDVQAAYLQLLAGQVDPATASLVDLDRIDATGPAQAESAAGPASP